MAVDSSPAPWHDTLARLLLARQGRLFLPAPSGAPASGREHEAVLLELAALGYAGSVRLRGALERLSSEQLAAVRALAIAVLATQRGADREHVPLFRRFPRDVPADTHALWVRRVLVHFAQAPDQPCLFCLHAGQTHVLRPCEHVVCDRCFDGSNYSACPICNRQVDRGSPFFQPTELPAAAGEPSGERVVFARLELGDDLEGCARALFEQLCARTQAPSPNDKADLAEILDAVGPELLAWLPAAIPVRETLALVIGKLLARDATAALPVARAHLRTATDVLRTIAVMSNADPALQGSTVYDYEVHAYKDTPWWASWAQTAPAEAVEQLRDQTYRVAKPRTVYRFPMNNGGAKLGRATRRALLAILEGLDPDARIEDMLRHRSYWVWVGEFLHPGEYARRYPGVAEAFQIVRKRGPDGQPAPRFRGFYSRLERAAGAGDSRSMLALLRARPGELARRFDHLLRVASADPVAGEAGLAEATRALLDRTEAISTPVLLTLLAGLPLRTRPAARRVFWPKGAVAKGVYTPDRRPPLAPDLVATVTAGLTDALLRRFARAPGHPLALIDDALADIVTPFNERTAAPAAVQLPRGSRIELPAGKRLRMFMHWCERERGNRTDLDLSVGLFSADWRHVGVCSYYQLRFALGGHTIATSAGDLTSAPFPDGSSEFVDLDVWEANAAGIRWAVMVVNAYAGDPFDQLERSFAGLMLRDDPLGPHFDPRTVALRFAMQGANGVYMPLCVDLERNVLHWLDVYATGQLAMNNVASSRDAIATICPAMIDYFASGARIDLRSLALLHAAARCPRVILRGPAGARVFVRAPGEGEAAFYLRLRAGEGGEPLAALELGDAPVLAVLHRGDVELPANSEVYALFREQLNPTLTASDLIR